MITTGNTKVKKRMESKPTKMVTTNKVQPKDFTLKGKPKAPSGVIITTSNVKELTRQYKKEAANEIRAAKERQKKLDEEIKAHEEKRLIEENKS